MGWFYSGCLLAALNLMVWELTGSPHHLFLAGLLTGISLMVVFIVVKSEAEQ